MQGPKTHEQQQRILEKKPDVPDRRRAEAAPGRSEENSRLRRRPAAANFQSAGVG